MKRVILGVIVGAAMLWPSTSSAQATLATANPGVLGQGHNVGIAASGAYYLRYHLTANRSYFAVCWQPNSTDQLTDCGIDIRNGSDVSVGLSNNIEPFDGGFTAFGGDGDSYLPTVSGDYYVRSDNFNAGAAQTVNIIVVETTLFSPWWFNASGAGYAAFTEIRNNTAESITVTIRAYNAAGAVVGTSSPTIAANGNTLVALASLTGDGSGSVSITFAGPPASISANTTVLGTMTGLSFDAPFTPRMTWSNFGSLQ
jgi:hypothetical protein